MTPRSSLVALAAFAVFTIAGMAAGTARADEYGDVDSLLGAGRLAEANQKADQFLSAKPKDARMRFLKGLVLSEQGKSNDAIAVFVKLTEDHPELPEPHNNLALLYAKRGDLKRAEAELLAALDSRPDYAIAYSNLGDVYRRLAEQAYAQAVKRNPKDTRAAAALQQVRPAAAAPAPASAPAAR